MFHLYITAFAMGLFGSLHCVGMCGGITIAFNQTTNKNKQLQLGLIYQLFRVISYSILGALSAVLGFAILSVKLPILPILSGVFMILLGLYLINISSPLLALEKIGYKIWNKIRPIQASFLPIDSTPKAIVIGLLWGFLPCGLVYSALALAISSADPVQGFIVMLCFGLGTLPMMYAMGVSSHKVVNYFKSNWIKNSIALFFIIMGAFYIWSAFSQDHSQHRNNSHEMHQKHQH